MLSAMELCFASLKRSPFAGSQNSWHEFSATSCADSSVSIISTCSSSRKTRAKSGDHSASFSRSLDSLVEYRKDREFREYQQQLALSAQGAAQLSEMRYQGG